MSLTLNIVHELREAGATLENVEREINRDDVKRIMGQAVALVNRQHFEQLAGDSKHHTTAASLGAERTGFYERAAKGVQQPQTQSDGFTVTINAVGIAQRLFGGTIRPKNAANLTIPARAEAYGHRAREFDFLKMVVFPSGVKALIDRAEDPHEGSVYYWLVKSATQTADPSVLPKEGEMIDPALERASEYLTRLWERKATP